MRLITCKGWRMIAGMMLHISRDRLIDLILADHAPVVVIDAPAGMGKTWLLQDIAARLNLAMHDGEGVPDPAPLALWDVPALPVLGPLPPNLRPGTRLILTKRPDTAIPGLARAQVYGQVSLIGADALLFSPDELAQHGPDLYPLTGGWPCLIPAAILGRTDAASLSQFLRDTILRPLSATQLVVFAAVMRGAAGLFDAGLMAGLPFVQSGAALHPALVACKDPMTRALQASLTERAATPQDARAIAVAHAAIGQMPEAIAAFQSIGAWSAALSTLEAAHGTFFIHFHGPDAFDAMLAGFPPDMARDNDLLTCCLAMQAGKRGELPLARRLLTDRFGPIANTVSAVLTDKSRFSLDFRFFRLLLRTWEDFDLTDQDLEDSYALLAEVPPDDDLARGGFYNAVLEFYIRRRRFAEAEHVAMQAERHYARAGAPILSFYIDLHRALIRLFMGDPRQAKRYCAKAAAALAATPFDSPGDARLLTLLEACITYESGQVEPLARFLRLDLDDFAHGEIWPSLVELTLIYGSQSLGEHYSTIAARSFLDRWRVTQERSSHFRLLIDIREVVVMQTGNRWQEAAQKAATLPSRITLLWVQSATDALTALHDRDEVALVLIWLRHMAQVMPQRPGLDRLLTLILDNPHLTARQRLGAEIWLAHVLRRQRRLPEAQTLLQRTLATAANQGSVAILGEERGFLTDLTATRRIRDHIDQSEGVRRILRQVQDTGPGRAERSRAHGLTRQEIRILHAVCEGAANKSIANALDLSEATVKFHLGNLYRKLGCKSRREAVAAAEALRLVA
jgi:DNA-binding CsgD family transcriptional regulator